MNKIKLIGLITGVVFIISIAVYLNELRDDKERLWNNNMQLNSDNLHSQTLYYTQKELAMVLSDSCRKLLKSLQIKPKIVTKIVENTVTIRDTVDKPVPVYVTGKDKWYIVDSTTCWKWDANVYLWSDSLIVDRTNFDYHNKQTDVFHKKLKRKFLFIKIYSRKEIIQKTDLQCGESFQKTIIVVK